jgi:hypothetical protein
MEIPARIYSAENGSQESYGQEITRVSMTRRLRDADFRIARSRLRQSVGRKSRR